MDAYALSVAALLAVGQATTEPMPYKALALAAFDESGKLNDSEVVAFGGCVLLQSTILPFTQTWEKRIKDEKLPHTSMKEAINFRGPYKDWKNDPDRRDKVILDLAAMVADSKSLRVVSPIRTAEFKQLDHKFRESLGNNPQYAGFEACMLGALQSRFDIGIQILCDLSEEYSEKCLKLYHKVRRNNADAKDRLIAIGFADDEVNAPLQAADMIAYCARADAVRGSHPPDSLVEKILEIFKTTDTVHQSVLYQVGGKGLGHGELESGA